MNKKYFLLLLLFALIRGSLYALMMPPWGLLDEEQHLDYIIKVSKTGERPIVGIDLLDDGIVKSVIETQRHSKFHWPTPSFN